MTDNTDKDDQIRQLYLTHHSRLRDLFISFGMLIVIDTVRSNGTLTTKQLSAIDGKSRSSAINRLKHLYDRGYLTREEQEVSTGGGEWVYQLSESLNPGQAFMKDGLGNIHGAEHWPPGVVHLNEPVELDDDGYLKFNGNLGTPTQECSPLERAALKQGDGMVHKDSKNTQVELEVKLKKLASLIHRPDEFCDYLQNEFDNPKKVLEALVIE